MKGTIILYTASSFLIAAAFLLDEVASHGRMLDPPGRSSMWRVGFNTPKNFNDNALNCGSKSVRFYRSIYIN